MTTTRQQIFMNTINDVLVNYNLQKGTELEGHTPNFDRTYVPETDTYVFIDQTNPNGSAYFINESSPMPGQGSFQMDDGNYNIEHVYRNLDSNTNESSIANFGVDFSGSKDAQGNWDSHGFAHINKATDWTEKLTKPSTFREYGTFQLNQNGLDASGSVGLYTLHGMNMNIMPAEDGRYEIVRPDGVVQYTVGTGEDGKIYLENQSGKRNQVTIGEKAGNIFSICDVDGDHRFLDVA